MGMSSLSRLGIISVRRLFRAFPIYLIRSKDLRLKIRPPHGKLAPHLRLDTTVFPQSYPA